MCSRKENYLMCEEAVHEQKCGEIIQAFRQILSQTYKGKKQTLLERFLFISSVVENQNSKTKGSGLSNGTKREDIFFDMMSDNTDDIERKPLKAPKAEDSDYYFRLYPFSHKTIGYGSGSPNLCLTWSKNPPGGIVRGFESSMIIVSFKPSCSPGRIWAGIDQGIYAVPLGILKETVVEFKSNNKTDTLIDHKNLETLVRSARDKGYYIPFKYDHSVGAGYQIRTWDSEPKRIRVKKPKDESPNNQLELFSEAT